MRLLTTIPCAYIQILPFFVATVLPSSSGLTGP